MFLGIYMNLGIGCGTRAKSEMVKTDIKEPQERGKIRQKLGKQYYILKRSYHWWLDGILGRKRWAQQVAEDHCDGFEHLVFEHRSVVMLSLIHI